MSELPITQTICKIELVGDNFKFSIAIKSEKDLKLLELFINTIKENLKETE